MDMSDSEVIETYRGLWEIEETFRVTKGVLETRPVYVSLQDHINAHFLTCFKVGAYSTIRPYSLIRIIQKKTGKFYSAEKIVECLNRISCSNEHENIYLFDYRSEISDAIGEALGIDFTNKRLRLGDIKKFWPKPKNEVLHYIFTTKQKGRYLSHIKGLRPFFCRFGVKVRF
jgi:hypothetical protein